MSEGQALPQNEVCKLRTSNEYLASGLQDCEQTNQHLCSRRAWLQSHFISKSSRPPRVWVYSACQFPSCGLENYYQDWGCGVRWSVWLVVLVVCSCCWCFVVFVFVCGVVFVV